MVEVALSSSGSSGMVAGLGAADWASWWLGDEENESGEDCCVNTESAVSSARSVRRDSGLDRCDLVGAVMTTGGTTAYLRCKTQHEPSVPNCVIPLQDDTFGFEKNRIKGSGTSNP